MKIRVFLPDVGGTKQNTSFIICPYCSEEFISLRSPLPGLTRLPTDDTTTFLRGSCCYWNSSVHLLVHIVSCWAKANWNLAFWSAIITAFGWTWELMLEEKPVQAFCSPEFFHYCSPQAHNIHLFKSKPVWLLQKWCCFKWICSKIIPPEATTESHCTVPCPPLHVHLHSCFDARGMCRSGLHTCCFLAATSQISMSCRIFLDFSINVKNADHKSGVGYLEKKSKEMKPTKTRKG